jgi:sRNA-binding regulator protein Hfq
MGQRPGSEDRKAPKRRPDEGARARANDLAASGMPIQMALAVAHGRMTLNEALEKMAQRDSVNKMMEKYALSRALATQIALGQASLELVLATRRMDDHRTTHRVRSILDESQASGEPVTLLLHGRRRITGKVLLVDSYMFRVENEEGGAVEDIHKLQVKAAFHPEAYKRVRKTMKFDKALEKEPRPPVPRPQDRYTCSDKRLFRYMDERVEVVATTLEGEVFRGHVEWFSRFEFALGLKGDASVVVFRHALHDLIEA